MAILEPRGLIQAGLSGPFLSLSGAIKRIRALPKEGIDPGFRVLIEFDESTLPDKR